MSRASLWRIPNVAGLIMFVYVNAKGKEMLKFTFANLLHWNFLTRWTYKANYLHKFVVPASLLQHSSKLSVAVQNSRPVLLCL